MAKRSAGLLLYRHRADGIEVLLAHPGGPFWARRDAESWSVPKGEIDPGEEPLSAARREFREETGHSPPAGAPLELGEVTQAGGKVVTAFAIEAEFDPASLAGSAIEMEWPPRSGRRVDFPEIDRVQWFDLEMAAAKILPRQKPFLDRLRETLSREPR